MKSIKNFFDFVSVLMCLMILLLQPVEWFAGGSAGAGKVENGIHYVAERRIYKPVNVIVYWYLLVIERCCLALAMIAMPYLFGRAIYLLAKRRPLDDLLA